LLQIITEKPMNESLSEKGYVFDHVFDFFKESRDFYTFMMTSDDYSFLSRKVEYKVATGMSQAIYRDFEISELDAYICASFLIRNTLMLFRIFSDEEVKLDKRVFRDRLIRLDTSGLSSFIDVKKNARK